MRMIAHSNKDVRLIDDMPWFFPILKLFFPAIDADTVAITIGNRIYCRQDLATDVLMHELTHCEQQRFSLVYGAFWCLWYLFSKRFRLEAEIEAYRTQYDSLIYFKGKQYADERLQAMARDLSGPMYGRIITFSDALKAINRYS